MPPPPTVPPTQQLQRHIMQPTTNRRRRHNLFNRSKRNSIRVSAAPIHNELNVLNEPGVYDQDPPAFRVATEPPSDPRVHDPGFRVREDLPGFRVREDLPGYRVREDLPGYRVREDLPGYRVRNDMPGFRVMDHLPSSRVRPGGMPSSMVYGQHQETPPRAVLVGRSHRRTDSTRVAAAKSAKNKRETTSNGHHHHHQQTADPRLGRYRQQKAEMELKRAAQYQNFVRRRRFFDKEQVMRLIPNRQPPTAPTV